MAVNVSGNHLAPPNYSGHNEQVHASMTRTGYMFGGVIDNSLKRSPELSSENCSSKMQPSGLPQGRVICAFTAGDSEQRRARLANGRLERKDTPRGTHNNVADSSTAKRDSGTRDRYTSGFLGMQGKHLFTDSPAPENEMIACSSGSAQSLEDRAVRGRRHAIDDRASI